MEAGARARGATPEERLLAIFDVFDEWFRREDFEACSFVNVLLEMGDEHPAGGASVRHLENIRSIVCRLAEEAGLRDPAAFARSFHILMKGSIVSAAEGDAEAASGPSRLPACSSGIPLARFADAAQTTGRSHQAEDQPWQLRHQ